MNYFLCKSDKPNKRFFVVSFKNSMKKIYFGDSKYENYTIHQDLDRKKRYLSRHEKNEDWHDPETPGFWARWLLWNKHTLLESIQDLKQKFGIHLVIAN